MLLRDISTEEEGIMDNKMIFNGTEAAFLARMNAISNDDATRITEANICIMGHKIQSSNMLNHMCLIFWALLLVFPLVIICTEWFKRKTEPAFFIHKKVYEKVRELTKRTKMEVLHLSVCDNALTRDKIKII